MFLALSLAFFAASLALRALSGLMREVPIDKVRECQNQFLDKLRSSAPEVIETLAAGKIDDATTQKIEAVMADIAGTYKA